MLSFGTGIGCSMKNAFSIVLLLVYGVFGNPGEVNVTVMEGDSVRLHTDLTDLQKNDLVTWRVGKGESTAILVEISKKFDPTVERFGDRLQVNKQNGDVTITNVRSKHSGYYKAEIITNAGTKYKGFTVTVNVVSDSSQYFMENVKSMTVNEGDSVTLHTDVQTRRDDLILWRFGLEGVLIAKDDKEDNKSSIYEDVLNGTFRHRLKLDSQTGSLIITNMRRTDTGFYHLNISRNNNPTLRKTFNVNVGGEPGRSSGEITGIFIGVLLAAAVAAVVYAGVFYYRHKNHKRQKLKVQKVTALEGSSVALHTDVKLQSGDEIQWNVRNKLKNTHKKIKSSSEEESDRLNVDSRTESLFIPSIGTEDAGLYKVKISSSSKVKSILQCITGGGPIYSQFNVIVTVIRDENDSVTLCTGVTDLQSDDEIQWRFRETLIAQIKNNTISTHDDVLDGIFSDKLKLDDQTGDLTITDLDNKHTGEYELKILRRRGTLDSQFKVIVGDPTGT